MVCIVHGVAKNQTQLSDFHFHIHLSVHIISHLGEHGEDAEMTGRRILPACSLSFRICTLHRQACDVEGAGVRRHPLIRSAGIETEMTYGRDGGDKEPHRIHGISAGI